MRLAIAAMSLLALAAGVAWWLADRDPPGHVAPPTTPIASPTPDGAEPEPASDGSPVLALRPGRSQTALAEDAPLEGHRIVLDWLRAQAPEVLGGERLILASQPLGVCRDIVVLRPDLTEVLYLAGHHDPTPPVRLALPDDLRADLTALLADPALAAVPVESPAVVVVLDGGCFVADLRFQGTHVRLGYETIGRQAWPAPVQRLADLHQRLVALGRPARQQAWRDARRTTRTEARP